MSRTVPPQLGMSSACPRADAFGKGEGDSGGLGTDAFAPPQPDSCPHPGVSGGASDLSGEPCAKLGLDKAVAAVTAAGAPHGSDTSNDPGCSGGGVIPVLFGGDDDEGLAGVDHDGAAHGSSISLLRSSESELRVIKVKLSVV